LLDSALNRAQAMDQVPQETRSDGPRSLHPVSSLAASSPTDESGEKSKATNLTSQEPAKISKASGTDSQAASTAAPPPTNPGSLESLTAKDGPEGSGDGAKKTEPIDPALVWKKELERLKHVAMESAKQHESEESAALWVLRAEAAEWLASDKAKTVNPVVLKRAVSAIADALKHPPVNDPSRPAEVRSAVLALERRAPLQISALRLCRNITGFGAFEPLEKSVLKLGETVLIYCEPEGLRYQSKGDSFVSRLSSRVELVSVKDGAKVWEQALGEAEDECRNPRRDCYVNYRMTFPATLAPGDFRLRLIQNDLIANRTATAELPVTITR
jgi:hypothetical protein